MADNNETRWSASETDWRAYAEKLAKDNADVGMSRSASDNNPVLQNRGLFDFQSMLNDFYGYKPAKDDTEGRMLKRSFQSNAIQSVMDTEMAKSLGAATTANSIDLMNATADAELRNKLSMNDQEFNFGMQKLGYESDLLMRDRGGSQKDILETQTAGDIAKIGAQGETDVNKIAAQGGVDIDKIRATGDEERKGQNNEQRLQNKTSEQNRNRARSLARSF
jgi:hypothetical protein